jgi:hypothetical protein
MNKTAKEQLNEWDSVLDEYETKLGLPKYEEYSFDESELQEYLSMPRNVLEKFTPIMCAEVAFRLAQFSFYLQRSINRENARINWAEQTVKEIIANEINNYKGYGYLEKSLQAIANNSKANSLSKIQRYAQQRSDRLSYLASSIKNLSDILIAIQRNKILNINNN